MYPFLLHLNFIQSFDIQFIHFPSSSVHSMSRWWFLWCLLSICRTTLHVLQTLLIKQNQLALKIDEKKCYSDLKNHMILVCSCMWLICWPDFQKLYIRFLNYLIVANHFTINKNNTDFNWNSLYTIIRIPLQVYQIFHNKEFMFLQLWCQIIKSWTIWYGYQI